MSLCPICHQELTAHDPTVCSNSFETQADALAEFNEGVRRDWEGMSPDEQAEHNWFKAENL